MESIGFLKSLSSLLLLYAFLLSVINSAHSVSIADLPLTSAFFNILAGQKYSPKVSSTFEKEYDYIVVGAGSAGAVIAARLSEMKCVNVLLLEAGKEPPILTEVPPLSLFLWFTEYDWQFKSVPQKYTGLGLENGQVPLPLGKMLGGTSAINNLLYVRGNKKNYDDWAAQGAEGWSYKDVKPYFLKLEDNRDAEFASNGGYHNTSGPMTVEQPRYSPLLKRYFKKAINDIGYEFVDSNAERQTGIYDLQANTRNGQRCSTAKAYLVPAENRTNLDILKNAMAKKVIIENSRAVGVVFDYQGKTVEAKAKREVIVSAGAINTPQLLMLSGVGPTEELNKFGIPVVADLPVGRNLHDHAAAIMPYVLGPRVEPIWTKLLNPVNLVQYMVDKSGPYSAITFLLYLAFLRGNSSSIPPDFPNYELYLGEITTAAPASAFYGLKKEVYEALFQPYDFKPMILCLVTQVQPRSRGNLTLSSTNIYDKPLIDPNYLADPRDAEDLLDGMKVCQRIGTSRALQKLDSRPFSTLIPGCEKYAGDEDSYFRCQLRHIIISAHHLAGTAKMGSVSDPTTVVDPQLRVKGIRNLRVVDASVMPMVTSGNTNIPVIMIAEKASDMIKKTIKCCGRNEKVKQHNRNILPDAGPLSTPLSPFQDSLDILQTYLDDFLDSPALKDNVTFIMDRLQNPLKFLDAESLKALQNIVPDIIPSLDDAISGVKDSII